MATVIERGEEAPATTIRPEATTPARLTTTLYDLMAALQDVVGPEDDTQVVATMVHLLRSGRLTGLERENTQERRTLWSHSLLALPQHWGASPSGWGCSSSACR